MKRRISYENIISYNYYSYNLNYIMYRDNFHYARKTGNWFRKNKFKIEENSIKNTGQYRIVKPVYVSGNNGRINLYSEEFEINE